MASYRQLTIDFFGDEPTPVPERRGAEKQKGQKSAERHDDRLFYMSLGSGSSGNCSYIGSSRGGILIDAGLRADKIEEMLTKNGIDMRRVYGILVTHDHSDHVRGAYSLLRTHRHMHIFCTNRVLIGMLRRHSISKRIKEYHRPIFKDIPFKVVDFEVTAFDVPHDGSDNMGFSIAFGDRNFVIATDLGEVQERGRHYMSQADYLVMEANYDARMLRDGPYPQYLKARIATANGHMDNADTARFLCEIAGERLKYVFLCHLSEDNNTPQTALATVRSALEGRGLSVGDCSGSLETRNADLQLMALPRHDTSQLFVFRP